ncbi:MAG: DUF4238 domain-containing protein [Bacteroidetes bacterium]|nr:DUF4238 domain-containing protein [Bacteroidota bacterium]
MQKSKRRHHILGEVYLKKFAFDYNGQLKLCVWEKGLPRTALKNVASFLNKPHFFQLSTIPSINPSVFENLNGQLETYYNKIIDELYLKESLSHKSEILLKQFVANTICRTEMMRTRINNYYTNIETKEKLLKEIAFFINDSQKSAIYHVDNIAPDDRLNYLMLMSMRHFNYILQKFDYCILKDYNNYGWVTSDNPIIIENNGYYEFLIPLEAELYFPLTRDYCLYLHHKNSEVKNNELRQIQNGLIIDSSESTHRFIFEKMPLNMDQYLIFPENLGVIRLDDKNSQ